MTYRLAQHITGEESTSIQWVLILYSFDSHKNSFRFFFYTTDSFLLKFNGFCLIANSILIPNFWKLIHELC